MHDISLIVNARVEISSITSLPSILKYDQLTANTDLDKDTVFNNFFSVFTDT